MKRVIRNIFGIILILALASCATWKSNTTTVYESTGTTLTEIRNTAKDMCDDGILSETDCVSVKNIYTQARTAYIVAGNALIIAMTTEDAVVKQKSLESYQQAMRDIATLIPQLITLAGELGITGGK